MDWTVASAVAIHQTLQDDLSDHAFRFTSAMVLIVTDRGGDRCRISACVVSGHRSAEIVHDDAGAARGQQTGVLPAQSPARNR